MAGKEVKPYVLRTEVRGENAAQIDQIDTH